MVHNNNFFNGDGKASIIGYKRNLIPGLGT